MCSTGKIFKDFRELRNHIVLECGQTPLACIFCGQRTGARKDVNEYEVHDYARCSKMILIRSQILKKYNNGIQKKIQRYRQR